MTELLLLLTLPEKQRLQYYDALRTGFPDVKVSLVDHYSKARPHIDTADVLVTFGPMLRDEVLQAAKRLKWIQALGTGVDGIVDQPSLPPGVIVTNMHGFHGTPMAEAAIAAMLALARGLPRAYRNQLASKWEGFPARTLKDCTLGIYGIGVIAATLAPLARAFGMRVIGISSAPRELKGFDRMYARSELEQAVREVDFLVLLTPYSAETRHSVNARVLDAMKPTSFLVNLARGGVVDEAALLEALRQERIAGAALDVFQTEPLPADHPFWKMPNVIVTPHLGGFFDRYPDYALPVLEANLRSFMKGEPDNMINLVRKP